MAETDKSASKPTPTFSDADKARARQWFKKAADCREKREYDYGIECYVTGLGYWPEAVEEGHMPLRSLAIQRQQVGGKRPGMLDGFKKPMSGKDHKQALLNAEHLLSKDPQNYGYAEGLLKAAIKAGLLETAKWVAPLAYELLKREEKLNKARFKAFRDTLVEGAALAASRGEGPTETCLLEVAVQSLDYLVARSPGDEDLRNEQRDLAGKLTIARGKYEQAEDFRDSLQDAEKQKLLHDSDRVQQGESTLDALVRATRTEWQAAPVNPAKINAYVDALLRAERKPQEDEAVQVLLRAYEQSRNYSFKLKADDVRLRQLQRQARALVARARQTGADDDKQQARLAVLEQRQATLEVYRERLTQYPTDLRVKFRYGTALFESGEYDEAIPVLQQAQADPRNRTRAQLLIGRAFLEKNAPAEACEVLREALERHELTDDTSKELMYWLARSYEAAGRPEEARTQYGKLLRLDYNYMNGDARQRLEALK
ncbi:MAG: tetratricopeptide repeat protein [Planctomycetota bacterium]